jgi:two-component system, chemotaxis family, protein-glutamate methylesterase/glutaminase
VYDGAGVVVIPTPKFDHGPRCAVAIGASAGGVQALRVVVGALPADLPAAVLIVLHLDPRARSVLPMLLAAATPLRVRDVRDESLVEAGTVYVAVPDRHLFVSDGHIRLGASAPLHHVRPSVDRLFESVALGWAGGAIGVILTGNGVDGAAGIAAIKRAGGSTLAQDPLDADYAGMPRAAIATGLVDTVLPLLDLGPTIARAAAALGAGRAA